MPTSLETLGMQLMPDDPNHFYVSTDMVNRKQHSSEINIVLNKNYEYLV